MLTGSDRCCPLRSGHWWPRCGPDVAPPPLEYPQSILTCVARAGHHLGIQHSVQRQACVRIEAVEFGRESLPIPDSRVTFLALGAEAYRWLRCLHSTMNTACARLVRCWQSR